MVVQTHYADGTALSYEVRGEGDPVLLIHGVLAQIETWTEVANALSATHRVLAYDRRGNGRSPNATPNRRVHADDAAALIRDVLGEPATVVGYSAGGLIGLELALKQPSLVKSLVVVEPPWHWFRPPSTGLLRVLGVVRYRYLRGRDRAAAEAFLRWAFLRQSGGTAWDDAPDSVKELGLGNAGGFKVEGRPTRYDLLMTDVAAKTVAECAVPVTFLLGEDSHAMFHRSHSSLTAALPGSRTIRVPKATHLLPIEAPGAIVNAVRQASLDTA